MAAAPFAFDGVVRLTRLGGGYLVFTLVIGFAALNTGNNSLYIGLSFMLGGLLASGIASKGGLSRFDVEILSREEAWAGERVEGVLRVVNRSRIWDVRDLVVDCDLFEQPIHLSLATHRTTEEVRVPFRFPRRGRVAIHHVDLYTRYPFGLFLKKRRVRVQGEWIVYPAVVDEDVPRPAAGARAAETVPRKRSGSGSDLFAFRDYVRGDSLRHVHWKKSASLGRWIMKQLEEETAPAVVVAVDPVRPAHVPAERFERMISEAATVLRDSLDGEAEVTLVLPEATIRGRGDRVRAPIFEALALVESRPAGDLPLVPRGGMLFSVRSDRASRTA